MPWQEAGARRGRKSNNKHADNKQKPVTLKHSVNSPARSLGINALSAANFRSVGVQGECVCVCVRECMCLSTEGQRGPLVHCTMIIISLVTFSKYCRAHGSCAKVEVDVLGSRP